MAEIFSGCPGSAFIRTPTLTEKICPVCGSVIELFSVDASVKCDKCGFVAYNDTQSCIQWCKYAEKCFGTEAYNRLVKKESGEHEAQER